jgi:hypothetical protein
MLPPNKIQKVWTVVEVLASDLEDGTFGKGSQSLTSELSALLHIIW